MKQVEKQTVSIDNDESGRVVELVIYGDRFDDPRLVVGPGETLPTMALSCITQDDASVVRYCWYTQDKKVTVGVSFDAVSRHPHRAAFIMQNSKWSVQFAMCEDFLKPRAGSAIRFNDTGLTLDVAKIKQLHQAALRSVTKL